MSTPRDRGKAAPSLGRLKRVEDEAPHRPGLPYLPLSSNIEKSAVTARGTALRKLSLALLWRRRLALAIVSIGLVVACSGTEGNNFVESRYATSTGSIEGYVIDVSSNPAVAVVGARVYTVPTGGVTNSGTAGYYRMDQVSAGEYTIHVARGAGSNSSTTATITAGKVARADVTFNAPAFNVGRELFVITDTGSEGQIARLNAQGTYEFSQLELVTTPGIGGQFCSLKMSRADTNELLVLSNYEHSGSADIFDVYLLRLSGLIATVTRVTNSTAPKNAADLSPDGQQIILSQDSDSNGRCELWIMNRDGTNARLFISDTEPQTGAAFDHRYPVWSSDGAIIAFSTRRIDSGATYDVQDYDIVHALVSSGSIVPVSGPFVNAMRGPLVPVTKDTGSDDVAPSWGERDLILWYSKMTGSNLQVYNAPADDGGSPETRFTDSAYSNYDPIPSNDRRVVAFVSTDDVDGSNPDHSPEITVGTPVGSRFTDLRHITKTQASPARVYNSVAWRLR